MPRSLPACAVLLVFGLTPGCERRSPADTGIEDPNLLMISVDTYRRDFLERYGGTTGTTAFMDELALRSVVFDSHTSCGNWTLESILCAANGRDNLDLDYVAKIAGEYRQVVPDRPSLASWLRDEGFYTVLLTSNGWLDNEWHHDAGFDFAEHPGNISAPLLWEKGRAKVLEAQDELGAERWFLQVHANEPHAPYNPPDEYLGALEALDPIDYDLTSYDVHQSVRGELSDMSEDERNLVLQHLQVRYEAEMDYFDDVLVDLFDDIETTGFLDNTVVLLWTDHGEQSWEREKWGHALDLYEEEVGAVAMLWHAGIEPMSWSEPTSHIDIVPTVLQTLGLDIPDEVTGSPVGEADADRILFHVTVANAGPKLMASAGSLRMHYSYAEGTLEVYDLDTDPSELNDLYDAFDPEQTALWEALDAHADELEPLLPEYTRVDPER